MSLTSLRWAFNLAKWEPTKGEWLRACQVIPGSEVERIAQYRFQTDAKASLLGQLMLHTASHRMLADPAIKGDIVMQRTSKGRPTWVRSATPITHFDANIAHHGHWVVLAAAKTGLGGRVQIGIDVMNLDSPRPDWDRFCRLMQRKFTHREWELIRSDSDMERQRRTFYRLWALKESFVKADGLGLGWNLQRIEFQLNSPVPPCDRPGYCSDSILHLDGIGQKTWAFDETILSDGRHGVAIAYHLEPAHATPGHGPNLEELTSVSELWSVNGGQAEGHWWDTYRGMHPNKP